MSESPSQSKVDFTRHTNAEEVPDRDNKNSRKRKRGSSPESESSSATEGFNHDQGRLVDTAGLNSASDYIDQTYGTVQSDEDFRDDGEISSTSSASAQKTVIEAGPEFTAARRRWHINHRTAPPLLPPPAPFIPIPDPSTLYPLTAKKRAKHAKFGEIPASQQGKWQSVEGFRNAMYNRFDHVQKKEGKAYTNDLLASGGLAVLALQWEIEKRDREAVKRAGRAAAAVKTGRS